MFGSRPAQDFFDFVQARLREGVPHEAKQGMIRASTAPMGFCNPVVNTLKQYVKDEKCKEHQTNLSAYSIVFCALILLGIGHSMPWSLGLPLIDDNIKRTSLPTYFAFMFFIKILGPISGFFVGALCNKLYYTLDQPAGLTPVDPRWIGAWWLGYLLVGAVLVGPAIALFCFPHGRVQRGLDKRREEQAEKEEVEQGILQSLGLPQNEETRVENGRPSRAPQGERKRQVALVDTHMHKLPGQDEKGVWNEMKTFGSAIKSILGRPVYTFSLIGRIFDAFAFKGYYSFLPKYLDNHFGIPQYKANVYLGSFGIVGFALGMLGGSAVMRLFKLEGRRAAAYVAICALTAATLALLKIGLGCQSVVNSLGPKLQAGASFTTPCNEHCNCGPVSLMPVCSRTGAIYYSPCHAGCENMTMISVSQMKFSDCQCIDEGKEVKRDWCRDDCGPMIVAFFALATASGLASGFGVVPGVLIVLRSVPPEWRSISIGFSGFIVSIGTLVSPPFYGWVIDSACILWEETCPGSDTGGSCLVYEASTLRVRLHVVYSVLRACGCLLDMAVLYHAKGLQLLSGGEEGGEDTGEGTRDMQLIGNPDIMHSNEELSKKISI